MANDNRSDIEKLSEGMVIKLLLIGFAEFIKSELKSCRDIGVIFCGECDPNAEYLVNKFLKEQVEGINKKDVLI